jgi:hypothetical protein
VFGQGGTLVWERPKLLKRRGLPPPTLNKNGNREIEHVSLFTLTCSNQKMPYFQTQILKVKTENVNKVSIPFREIQLIPISLYRTYSSSQIYGQAEI